MSSKQSFLARIFLCTVVVACALTPWGRASAVSQPAPTPTRAEGEDGPETKAPLEMSVNVSGRPEAGMELRVTVRTRLASARGELTLHSPDGSLAAGADGEAWHRGVEVTRSAKAQEVFRLAPAAAEGASLSVEFVSDGRPSYYAKIGYTVTLRRKGRAAGDAGGLTPVVERIVYPMTEPEAATEAQAGEDSADAAEVTPACANCTTVRGKLFFNGPQNTTEAPWEATVEAWDHDSPQSSDDFLGLGFIDQAGNFQITFTNGGDEDGTRADVYLIVKTDSKKQKVVDPGRRVYQYRTWQTWWDLQPNTGYDLGSIKMDVTGNVQLGFFVYRWMSQGWHYVKNNFGSVPTDDAYVVVPSDNLGSNNPFEPHGPNTAHFIPPPPWGNGLGFGEIHIGSNVATGSIITHEYGHYVQYRLNGNRFRWWDPAIIYGDHYMDEPMRTRAGAWVEGWADYFSAAARGNPRYYWSSTVWFDFEHWTCSNAPDACTPNRGDSVEGRIAATLWDLIDSTSDGETSQHAHATIIDVFDEEVLVDFYDFFLMWINKGHSCAEFTQVAAHNTIDYQCGGEHASFNDWSVPDRMDAGKTYPVWVTMVNDGAWPWREMGRVRLGSQNPQDNMTWGLNRVRLAENESVDAGEYHTFVFDARAPSLPGFYPFQWQMVRDGHFWFEAPTPTKLIQVVCEAPGAVGAGAYDNTSSAIRYCGPWSSQSGTSYSRAYQSSVHLTDTQRATAAFRFTGSRLTYRFSMAYNRGPVDVFIDGSFKGTVTPRADEVRRQAARSWDLPYGTHVVEVRAAGGPGNYVDLDAFHVDAQVYPHTTVYDSSHAGLNYVGTWGSGTNPSRRWSNVTGDTMTFNFYGSSIVYSYTLAPNRGMAAVTIDGVDHGLVDLYASSTLYRSRAFTNLGPGPHTITITVSGKRNAAATDQFIDVDSLQPLN